MVIQPACATPVCEGACVATDTEEVQHNIRSILTLLKANHPDDCMKCEVPPAALVDSPLHVLNLGSDAISALLEVLPFWRFCLIASSD